MEGEQTVGSAVLRARRRVNPTATHREFIWTQTQWWGAPAARERRRKGPRTGTAAGAMIDAITADGNSIVVVGCSTSTSTSTSTSKDCRRCPTEKGAVAVAAAVSARRCTSWTFCKQRAEEAGEKPEGQAAKRKRAVISRGWEGVGPPQRRRRRSVRRTGGPCPWRRAARAARGRTRCGRRSPSR